MGKVASEYVSWKMGVKVLNLPLGRFEIVDLSGFESMGINSAGPDSAGFASAGLGFEIYHKNSVADTNTFQIFRCVLASL